VSAARVGRTGDDAAPTLTQSWTSAINAKRWLIGG
jgi:hypothetical protein